MQALFDDFQHVRIRSRLMCAIHRFSRPRPIISDDDIPMSGAATSWQTRLSSPLCQIECSAARTGAQTLRRRDHPWPHQASLQGLSHQRRAGHQGVGAGPQAPCTPRRQPLLEHWCVSWWPRWMPSLTSVCGGRPRAAGTVARQCHLS